MQSNESILDELLSRYHALRRQGQTPAPEEVCADHPELVDELKARLKAQASMEAFLDVWEAHTPGPAAHSSAAERGPEHAAGQAGDAGEGAYPTLPGYELLDVLGRGGMGVVYRARDVRLNREVAVKFLREDCPAEDVLCARFVAEAQITGQLQHPGIPAVHELGSLPDGQPFLAMKLVKGQTLAALLHERTDPGDRRGHFLAIFEQVCQAVGYAHAHRVIHRDLKPHNVMVGAFGEVQVMDWGLAKVLPASRECERPEDDPEDELPETVAPVTAIETPPGGGSGTRTGQVMGTPAYMAPEQAGGEVRRLDARSDVFGLGAILCQMLTGRPPYQGTGANDVRLQAVRGELGDALARLDACGAEPDLVDLCKRCLAFRQEDRPADGGAVAAAVAGIRAAAEERARRAEQERAEALVREAEQRKRRRVWIGLAASLLIGVSATTVLAVVANQQAGLARRKAADEESERKRAEEHFRQAEEAVTQYLSRITDDPALKERELRDLRKQLLTSALPFFRQLAEQEPTRLSLRFKRGQALRKLAHIHRETGAHEEAENWCRQALAEFQYLTLAGESDPDHRYQLGGAHFELARVFEESGRKDQAEAEYKQALAAFEELARIRPGHAAYDDARARTYTSLGKLSRDPETARAAFLQAIPLFERAATERPDVGVYRLGWAQAYNHLGERHVDDRFKGLEEAEKAYFRALNILEDLIRQNELVSEYRFVQAAIQRNLASLYSVTKRWSDAQVAYEQVRRIEEELLRRHPTVTNYRNNLANTYLGQGRLYVMLKQPQEAEAVFLKAQPLLQDLVRLYPQVPRYGLSLGAAHLKMGFLKNDTAPAAAYEHYAAAQKSFEGVLRVEKQDQGAQNGLIQACAGQASTLGQLGRHAEALSHWDNVLETIPDVLSSWFRLCRAVSLAHVGKHAEATREATQLAEGAPSGYTTDYLLKAAMVHVAAAAKVVDDRGLAMEKRSRLAEEYAARAVALLQQAVANGYADLKRLESDHDLRSLRDRADFKRFLDELRVKAPKRP